MPTLSTELRNKLERTIVQARDVAEAGVKAALEALAVHHHEPYGHMSPEDRKLRNHLRAKARQLGDRQNRKGELEIPHLVRECAYEHWHRMLFARFLAENDLLIEPEMGIAISLEECEELAKEEGKDLWILASEFAQGMLPQIFRPDDPILKVTLAREYKIKLEKLLDALESDVFTGNDSLGWVYQFWQSKRKKEVNQSGNKIGADELPAVTQLFTEPYMVSFLLDNSLGAWWAASRLTEADLQNAGNENELRKKASLPDVPLEYLRFVKLDNGSWTPAAGAFDGWPEHLSELKTLDPCCGSGHFLVAALLMLVPIRMELEGLSAREAVDAVLQENLHGLEIDNRCVELAVFALALTAWTYPEAGGYRPLPELNFACSGLAISAKKEEWLDLAGDNTNLHIALEELYKQFNDAPVLGSLINPEIGLAKESLFELKWEEVGPLLTKALSGEKNNVKAEMGVVAQGIAKAANFLAGKYHWIITNYPYLTRVKQDLILKEHLEYRYSDGKPDLATAFILRGLGLNMTSGVSSLVVPQNWLFLDYYKKFRAHIISNKSILNIVELGPGAFSSITGEVVQAVLVIIQNKKPLLSQKTSLITVRDIQGIQKHLHIRQSEIIYILQSSIKSNPDSRIVFEKGLSAHLLSKYASYHKGLCTGDDNSFKRCFWEVLASEKKWLLFQGSPTESANVGGCHFVLDWENGEGRLIQYVNERLGGGTSAWIRGLDAWGKKGVTVRCMGQLPVSQYYGTAFDTNVAVIIPFDNNNILPIWAYCSSEQYHLNVRKINRKMNVGDASLVKVPLDLEYWQKVSRERYPNGLPKPYSDDPTQWIFHGHPAQSNEPLQVAVARLFNYRWPAELDSEMELSDGGRVLVARCEELLSYTDEDGIVCIPPVRTEYPAADRLREILAAAFGPDWSPAREQELIKISGANVSNLDEWLHDHFFEQHCKLFHHRPFIWDIWDGRRRDGFHALVNYHKLAEGNGKGRQLLESLTYSYLGDWITRQKDGVKRGAGGAEDRLAAALELQKRLIAIIEGEPPFDIFVRWKPIEEQPIGWEPDINDGVRLNIRPFMAQDIPGGRKGAGILRWKPNIKWNKDRGKEPYRSKEQHPWFWKDGEFTGDRVNDIHLSINDKQKARKEKEQT